jgi:hypothetical protein
VCSSLDLRKASTKQWMPYGSSVHARPYTYSKAWKCLCFAWAYYCKIIENEDESQKERQKMLSMARTRQAREEETSATRYPRTSM